MPADIALAEPEPSASAEADQALAGAAELLSRDGRATARRRARKILLDGCRAVPDRADLWDALGLLAVKEANWRAALGAFAEAGRIAPGTLAYALHRAEVAVCAGSFEAELQRLALAISLDPLDVVPLAARGVLLAALGREDEAIDTLTAASLLAPESAEIHALLGGRLANADRLIEAESEVRQAIALGAPQPDLRNTLGAILMRRYRHHAAYTELAALIAEHGPATVPVCNLASAASSLGRQEESETLLRDAIAREPEAPLPWRTLCNTLPYRDGITAADLLGTARAYAERLPHAETPPAFAAPADPAGRLRIGLLSGSLRIHPVGWLTIAGLEMLDRAEFALIGLSAARSNDMIARRFHAACEEFHAISRFDDASLAHEIRRLAIDIVIDLGGYGDAGRMPALAHRAAPVQIKWVGMQNHSTGLPEIDWFLTDRWETPEGHESLYSERLLRMPDGYICYSPPPYAPDVAPLPALSSGSITFGCLNNLAKITPRVIATWSRILSSLPNSRLLLKTHQFAEAPVAEELTARFAQHGIPPERLILVGKSPHREFLAEYNRVDLQLDPFPYSGGLTTCEALWMGVPTITLPGDTFSSRHSLSHLSNAGLADWVAHDPADYENLAIAKSSDLATLAHLRANLRARVASSPLCDAQRFGRNLGQALRFAWAGRPGGLCPPAPAPRHAGVTGTPRPAKG